MDYNREQEEGLHFLDYWRVIRSRKEIVLAVIILVVLSGTLATFLMDELYQAQARILVKQDALDIDVFEREMGGGYNPYFLRTQFEVLQSRPLLYKVISELDLAEKWGRESNEDGSPLTPKQALRRLRENLNVEQYRDTSLISIQVVSKDPDETANIANKIAEVYREDRLSRKRRETERGINALKNELEKQQKIVEKAEENVEAIRQKLGITTLGRGIKADTMRLQQLEADRISARVDMLARKARLDQLTDLSGKELMHSASYIVNDDSLRIIRQQLIDTSVNLKIMLENLGENHPDVRMRKAALSEQERKLEETLAGLKAGLNADYEVSRAKYTTLEEELRLAREQDIESQRDRFLPFDKAERELAIQRDILTALRARVAQEGIEIEVPRTPVELVDPAETPKFPFSPNLLLNILVSLFLGVMSGVGLAYFIEYLDTSVKTVDDVERYLQLPVIGVIPQNVRPLIEEGPETSHAEAYRVLRTNMLFNSKEVKGGAFTVVSGGVGEGKSTTLFNLAYVCAQLGDKVLIVDSDLRRPVQHSILNVTNHIGLTNVLLGDAAIEDAVVNTPLPNLHFLPSGRMRRSSMGILDSSRMRDLMKDLKEKYDYVFFDSPPIVGVSDASVLSSEADGVLLVVQYRKYPRVISARAKRMVENVGGNLLGVVLNNINIFRDDYYYYYHSYHTDYHKEPDESSAALPESPGAASTGGDRL